jgi:membrane protein DedA with SNARE-associated domain
MTDSLVHINTFLDQVFARGPLLVYIVLFVACFIENVFPPFPGDTFIAAAGALVAADRLHVVLTLAVMISGGLASVMLLYFLGRNYGRDYFIKKNFRYFSALDVVRMETRLQKWGALVILVSRFVVGLRSAVAVAAGMARYDTAKMVVFSALSYLVFTGLIMYLAASVVRNFAEIEEIFATYTKVIWPIVIGAVVIFVVHRFWVLHRKRRK